MDMVIKKFPLFQIKDCIGDIITFTIIDGEFIIEKKEFFDNVAYSFIKYILEFQDWLRMVIEIGSEKFEIRKLAPTREREVGEFLEETAKHLLLSILLQTRIKFEVKEEILSSNCRFLATKNFRIPAKLFEEVFSISMFDVRMGKTSKLLKETIEYFKKIDINFDKLSQILFFEDDNVRYTFRKRQKVKLSSTSQNILSVFQTNYLILLEDGISYLV